MDDNFLFKLYEQPNPEFVKNLQRRLSQNEMEINRGANRDTRKFFNSNLMVKIAALLVIVVIAGAAISPVRAFISSLITQIAGQTFVVTNDYPGDVVPGNEETIYPDVMSLQEALTVFPYTIHLPTYMPSGYKLNDNVRVYIGETAGPFANTIVIDWKSIGKLSYILRINDQNGRNQEVIAPESATEEVMLDDKHSAVLIRGGWDNDTQSWNIDHGLRIKWLMDNLTYDLMGSDKDQLIEIATSVINR
jgi:hypothetical protein